MTPSSSKRQTPSAAASRSQNAESSTRPTRPEVREKALPRLPDVLNDSAPTLHPERLLTSTPQPQSKTTQHSHSRSITDPLPRLFNRKKKLDGHDASATDTSTEDVGPTRGKSLSVRITGKGEDTKVTRQCMCCGNKVGVPDGIPRFRCLACLTINELSRDHNQPKDVIIPPISLSQVHKTISKSLQTFLEQYIENRASISDQPREAVTPLANELRSQLQTSTNLPKVERSTSNKLAAPSRPAPPPPRDSAPELRNYVRSNDTAGRPSPLRSASLQGAAPAFTDRAKHIFRPLEQYLLASFGDWQCLNTSFHSNADALRRHGRSISQTIMQASKNSATISQTNTYMEVPELDPKLLLLGELGENSSWWTGKFGKTKNGQSQRARSIESSLVNMASPQIDYKALHEFYEAIHTAGRSWKTKVLSLQSTRLHDIQLILDDTAAVQEIDSMLSDARHHAVRTLLKISENLLKHPAQALKTPDDIRFLLIILANPSLRPNMTVEKDSVEGQRSIEHTGILKRICGFMANCSDTCHHHIISWLKTFEDAAFVRVVDLMSAFINHRLARGESSAPRKPESHGGLIPDLSAAASDTSVQLHTALGLSGSATSRRTEATWADDWQLKCAAKVMSLIFAANNARHGQLTIPVNASARPLPLSRFYVTMLDRLDMIQDFRVWETSRERFAFCQYPFFLSLGNKIKILEYDAKRQMESKVREAYFNQILRQRTVDGHLYFRVRRECLVDDSLRQISEAVGAGQDELKKGLRVQFDGEEGVDAGGLRKEWFLMLVREIFDPEHGMFIYDEDSRMCYFNSQSFETSDQYYLVGALFGLAIYNGNILDVAFPSFAFRKLLAAAPHAHGGSSNKSAKRYHPIKSTMQYTLADLAQFRPSLASGLQQLLDYEGDVQATFCMDFVVPVERYGSVTNHPLMPGGETVSVTNANREEFVNSYITWLLDTSVTRQFEPFKRGFYSVCAGNALTLFRAEEIEMLVRGSDEQLDVDALKTVAMYDNWRTSHPTHSLIPDPAEHVPVLKWFWELLSTTTIARQRKLLAFVTGSDRIPAVGATSLVLRIVAGGDGWGGDRSSQERFPIARTCFDTLVLWHYDTKAKLQEKLWRAVEESTGFGLK